MWRLYDYMSVFQSRHTNDVINTLFWYCLILGFIFYNFDRYLRVSFLGHSPDLAKMHWLIFKLQFFLKRSKIKFLKRSQTILFLWNICFHLAVFIFLNLYHNYFIAPEVEKESGKFFPKYKNILFLKACDTYNFKVLSMMLVSHSAVNGALCLKDRNFSEFATNFLYGCLLLCCYAFG